MRCYDRFGVKNSNLTKRRIDQNLKGKKWSAYLLILTYSHGLWIVTERMRLWIEWLVP